MVLRRLVRLALLAALASAVRASIQATRSHMKASQAVPGSADTWPPVPRRPQ
jgi:hypothetical protein